MSNRTANYTVFYVSEPFYPSNLEPNIDRDFRYYNMLKAWKASDETFHFVDAHAKTYSVRDDSDWEKTLKPRLHERLNASKNIILFLSSITKDSRALHEEIDYGINTCHLPVIVVYPDFSEKSDVIDTDGQFKRQVINLWDKLPIFRNNMNKVATLHIPLKKDLIKKALYDESFEVGTMTKIAKYYY